MNTIPPKIAVLVLLGLGATTFAAVKVSHFSMPTPTPQVVQQPAQPVDPIQKPTSQPVQRKEIELVIQSSTTSRAKIYNEYKAGIQSINATVAETTDAKQYNSIVSQLAALKKKYTAIIASPYGQPGTVAGAAELSDYYENQYQELTTPLEEQGTQLSNELNTEITSQTSAFKISLCDTNPEIASESDREFCHSLFTQ